MIDVLFLDCGSHREAKEIDMMTEVCRSLGLRSAMYAIEPNPTYTDGLIEKFSKTNVIVLPVAVSCHTAISKLYNSKSSNGHGSSLFDSKNNVDLDDYWNVQTIRMSSLLNTLKELHQPKITVLKYNIEGSEWSIINELIDTDMHVDVDVYCGASCDMHKVDSLKDLQQEFHEKCVENGVFKYMFYHSLVPEENKAMIAEMKALVLDALMSAAECD